MAETIEWKDPEQEIFELVVLEDVMLTEKAVERLKEIYPNRWETVEKKLNDLLTEQYGIEIGEYDEDGNNTEISKEELLKNAGVSITIIGPNGVMSQFPE